MAGYSSLGNAYWTANNGVAGLMYGGGDFSRAHCANEYITIDELVETAQVFCRFGDRTVCLITRKRSVRQTMTEDYRNKVIIVTGASAGIGKELSLALLRKGGRVVACSRHPEKS